MTKAWRSEKVKRTRVEMQPFVDRLTQEMPDVEWYFGGSWRRGTPTVGDLDIVIVLEDGTFDESLFEPGVQLPSAVHIHQLDLVTHFAVTVNPHHPSLGSRYRTADLNRSMSSPNIPSARLHLSHNTPRASPVT